MTAILLESLPRARVRVNAHASAQPRPAIGAFEVMLRVGPGEADECLLFSKVAFLYSVLVSVCLSVSSVYLSYLSYVVYLVYVCVCGR